VDEARHGAVNGFWGALSFLTRVRGHAVVAGPERTAAWVPWFPVVGALVGLAVALVHLGARLALPPPAAAAVAIAAGVGLTGALHEDGLADLADALGGGRGRREVLALLEDPRLGTYGVAALSLSLILRTGALAALTPAAALAALPAAHALSRAAAVALLATMSPAAEGLGAAYGRFVTRRGAVAAGAAAIGVGALGLGPWVLAAAALAGIAALAVGRLAARVIGGITGDVLGAAQQVAEITILLLAAALVGRGWGPPP